MDLSDARQRLVGTNRHELRDHAFGDAEVHWTIGDHVVAYGLFGGGHVAAVQIYNADDEPIATFEREDAYALREEGHLIATRNDETGPDEYQEGKVMPGLTKEGVYKELTGEDLPPAS